MIGIVVVSHSAALAAAAIDLAGQMVHGEGPKVALAAGTADGGLGTDAARVAEAIDEVAGPDGVLVLMDLGSAVLSAELALEFRSSDAPVRLTAAPIVEGLVAGLVRAAAGGSLDQVAQEALGALAPKAAQLEEPAGAPESAGGEQPPALVDSAAQPTNGDHAPPAASIQAAPESAGGGQAPPEASAVITLLNPGGLHARPAAALAEVAGGFAATVRLRNRRTGNVAADASSMSTLLVLDARHGDEVEVEARGTDAAAAVAEIERLAADGFGEGVVPVERPAASIQAAPESAGGGAAPRAPVDSAAQPANGEHAAGGAAAPESAGGGDRAVEPIGVSPGVAVAPVVRMPDPIAEPADGDVPETDRAAAAERIPAAFDAVRAALEHRAQELSDDRFHEARAVLEATAALASDRALADAAAERVTARGQLPERAVWETIGAFADRLAAQGGAMRERAADVRDLRARVVARLTGRTEPGLPERDEPFVLAAHDLAPADAALLGTTHCVGLLTRAGGPTSHTAILARSLGLPAVISPAALEVPEGATVLIDGGTGEVVVDPPAERVAVVAAQAAAPPFDGDGRTADGRRVELLANVGSGADAQAAAAAHAEGVGLFRTEFVFLDRQDAPGFDEQVAAYRPVLAAFAGRKVIVRTLDAGADKPLPFVTADAEPNPALGVRGYRTSRRRPELLDEQLRAIAAAAEAERAEASVMAPMIDTPAEARAFAELARGHGIGRVGVMIETPAAALGAAEILAEVDFVSLGTNDLAQYTMAADRQLAALAALTDAWQPAVLRLIRLVGEAGAACGKPVGVCGEAGADPALAPVLAGLGVTSLSMTPRALDAVAFALRGVSRQQCVAAADAATAAADPKAARAAAAAALAG
ncbi:phosphoenolpyruvate--protein phosphotransferase [Gryllotalpicola ginsengisoli]|uniref:phosphoenolpyruvate--protein phosphotransferase n=1 Tax=Gryllotalpicola ginsengisoli TaxID=444608 RepID=UPI0003B48A8C|nr:phosphoenolpyruvate--protein phosphotransferase [Gryllotalpicola ginsengisoli]